MISTLSVAFYARVSSQGQANDATIQSQVAALQARIQQDGLTIDEERCFVDDGYSGGTLVRPSLERLRDLAWSGGVDRLYVLAPDRLARKYVAQAILLEEFQKHGVEVVFLSQPRDPSAEGELLLQMQGMIAEYERAKILERTRRGRRFAARQGKLSVMGRAPYGYRYIPKHQGDGEARYDVLLEEARVVRDLFTWVGVEGLSLRQVVARLAAQGVRPRKGGARWDRATIRGILRNTAYRGVARYGKTRVCPGETPSRPQRGKSARPRPEKVQRPTLPEEQEELVTPVIVDGELFAAVVQRLDENRRRRREQEPGSKFLLSGLLVCPTCGSACCGESRNRLAGSLPYRYYRCLGTTKHRHGGVTICQQKSVRAPELEEAVWSDVRSLLEEPARLQRELSRRLEQPPPQDADHASLSKSIAGLKRRLSRLLDAYEGGWLQKPEFEKRMKSVKDRLDREEASLLQHERDISANSDIRLVVSEFSSFAEQMRASLATVDFATKRQLLRLLVNRIEIDTEEVRIVYKVPSHPFAYRPASTRGILQHWLHCDRESPAE